MDSIDKFVVPAVVALVSWLIKDFLFDLSVKRNEALRREWEFRLKEIWSPLYFWSGIVLFADNAKEWDKHGLADLEKTLAKSTHLIPRKQLYTFVKLVELASGQKTAKPTIDEIQKAREYVYSQIELLNYLLYRKTGMDDVSVKTNLLHPYRHLLRLLSPGVTHLAMWVAISGLILAVYSLYSEGYYWPLGVVAVSILVLIVVLVWVDIRKRKEIEREIQKRVNS